MSYTFLNAAFELSSDATFTGQADTTLSLHASDKPKAVEPETPADRHAFRFNAANTTFTTFKKIELVGEGSSKQSLVPSKGNSTLSFGTSTSDVIGEVILKNLNVGFWNSGNTINFYTEKLEADTSNFIVTTDNTVTVHGVSDSQTTTIGTLTNKGGTFTVEQGNLTVSTLTQQGGETQFGVDSDGKSLGNLTIKTDVTAQGGKLSTYAKNAEFQNLTVQNDGTIVSINGVGEGQTTSIKGLTTQGGVFTVEQGSLTLEKVKTTGGETNLGSGSGKTLSALTLSGDVDVSGGTLTTYADNAQFQNVTVSNKASIAIKGAAEGQSTKIAALKNYESTISVDAGALEVSGTIVSTGTTTFGQSPQSALTELRVNDKTSVSKGTFSAYAEKAGFKKLDINNAGTKVQLTTTGAADDAADLTINGLIQTTNSAELGIQAKNFELNGQVINKNSSITVGGADAKLSSFKVVSNRENAGYSTLQIGEGGSLNVHAGSVDITGGVSAAGSKSEVAFDAADFSVRAGSAGEQHLLSASDGAKLTVVGAANGKVSINAERSAVLTSTGGTFEVTQGALDVTGIVQANEGSTIKLGSEEKPLASASFKSTDAETGALRSNGGDFALYADDIAIDGGDGMAVESFNLGRKYDGAGNFVIQAGKTLQVKGDITSGADHGDPTSGVSKDTVLSIGAGETVQIEGDVVSYNQDATKNAVNITLSGEDSYLKGAVKNLNAKSEVVTESAGGTTLNLANGAGWIVTDKSNVKELSVAEGGGSITTASVAEGTVEIGSKTGAGDLTVNITDTSTLSGDTESIEKALTGIVKIDDGDKSYTIEAAESSVIGDIEIGVGADGTISSFSEKANSVTQSLEDVASFNVLGFRAQMNDLDKRMGDLRSMPASDGTWARWFGGKSEYRSSGFKSDYNAIQVGVDHRFTPEVFAGLTFTYTDNDGTLANGTSDSDTYSFGVYGGWLSPDGQFVDVTVKRHRVNTDFSIRNTAGLHEGSYGMWGTSFSVEYGWRLTCPNSGFYVEPQVEFNYGRLESVDYGTSLGSRVHQNSVTNTVGRVGAAVGYVFPEKAGSVYLKASWLHDWDGKSEGTRGDGKAYRTFSEDLGGTWGEFAMGGTYNVTNFLSAYGEVQTTTGSPIKNPWQASAGVRWSF